MKATLLRDKITGRAWLEFVSKPDAETITALKAEGWRWSGYRKAWHNPRRYVMPPPVVEFEDGGECDYSAERAERLEERADKAEARSESAHERVRQIADAIPFGQPILVGHHSERHARRDAERIRSGMGVAVAEAKLADELRHRAAASERHQAEKQSAGVISRRLDRLRAELRKLERQLEALKAKIPAHCADPNCPCPDREVPPPAPTQATETFARWTQIAEALRADIKKNEEALAALGPTLGDEQYAVGEIVKVRGHVVKITRVNRKTISGVIVAGGAAGMTGKWERSWIQKRIEAQS